jgi:hypothetical protein
MEPVHVGVGGLQMPTESRLYISHVTADTYKISVFWDVSPDITSKVSVFILLHAGFLLGLHLDPEDGGNIFVRNVGFHRTVQRHIHEDRTLHNHRSENARSYN